MRVTISNRCTKARGHRVAAMLALVAALLLSGGGLDKGSTEEESAWHQATTE